MQANKPTQMDIKQYEMRPEGAAWQLSEPRDVYRKNSVARAGHVNSRYQPYIVPRYQFTVRDLDRCLYGKQDLQVVHIDQKGTDGNTDDKPAKWCDMCQEIRFGECPSHGPLHSVRPSITLPFSQKSYAISTFPDEVGLCISSLPLVGFGVFARHFIPLGTWIGPYEGRKLSAEEGLSRQQQQNFMWEIFENGRLQCFLDASDENVSSWMRFIQCARHKQEQNLYIFQYYGSIYYRAFKDIPVGTELMVWYDEKYPHFLGLPTEIRDMSSYSVESIQAPVEVANKLAEGDASKTPNPATPILKHASAVQAPPKTYPEQYRSILKVSPPQQQLTVVGQIQSPTPSKTGHVPVYPPMLTQAPGLQIYETRGVTGTGTSTTKSFSNSRVVAGNRNNYQTQSPLPATPIQLHASPGPMGYVQVTSIAQSVRPSASSSQSYLSKPSVLPPPSIKREHQFQGHSCLPDIPRQFNYDRMVGQNNSNSNNININNNNNNDVMHVDKNQEKPYKCGICQHSFATSVTLSTHMRLHGVEKPFECQNCGKTFAHAALLNRHKKTPSECTK
eukprot:gene9873-10883_t